MLKTNFKNATDWFVPYKKLLYKKKKNLDFLSYDLYN